jgi:hypothetical protein
MSQPSETQRMPPQPPQGTPNNQGPARPNLTRQKRKTSGGDLFWFACKALGLIFFIIVVVSFYDAFRAPAGPSPSQENGSAEAKAATKEERPEDLERRIENDTARGVQRNQLALAKFNQQQVLDVGAEVNRALEDWGAELDRWESDVSALLQNDRGKGLGANGPLVKRFRAVYDIERPGREEVDRLRSLAEGLVSAVKTSHDNPADGTLPTEGIRDWLRDLVRQAREGKEGYQKGRKQIESLVSQASRMAAGGGDAGAKPLAEAIKEQAEEEALAETAYIAEKTRRAREEAADQVAKAQIEATDRVARAKTDQIREAGEKQEAVTRAETVALRAQKEKERLRRLAESPAIQAQFVPFLGHGKWLFANYRWGQVAEPAPYSNIQSLGCLQDAKAFARAMSGTGETYDNDRQRFPLASTPAEMKRMEQLLELFKELAPTWVEMGKLMP